MSPLLTKKLSNSGNTWTEIVNGRSILAPIAPVHKALSGGIKISFYRDTSQQYIQEKIIKVFLLRNM